MQSAVVLAILAHDCAAGHRMLEISHMAVPTQGRAVVVARCPQRRAAEAGRFLLRGCC